MPEYIDKQELLKKIEEIAMRLDTEKDSKTIIGLLDAHTAVMDTQPVNVRSFNELPIHCKFLLNGREYVKLTHANPSLPVNSQPPNCIDLTIGHYCVVPAHRQVCLTARIDEYSD